MLGKLSGGSSQGGLLSSSRGVDPFYEVDIDLVSELQAPLLGIAANAKVAKLKLNDDNSRTLEYLQAIEFSSQNLVKLINILLKSRDVDTSSLALEVAPIHLGIRVEEAIEKLEPLCRLQAQVFDFKLSKNLVVSANMECLDLVVYHILEQALRSSAGEEIVDLKMSSSGGMAKLSVHARGSREKASVLRSTLKRAEGKKLGINFSLVASYRLLRTMGGNLNISQRKDGICFNFSLPLSKQGDLFGA